ncbi:hypothetical protein PMAYCL1PPCAC_24981, partial [Pristionchus mayeri]
MPHENRRAALPKDSAEIVLRCDTSHNRRWKCEAEVEITLRRHGGYGFFVSDYTYVHKFPFSANETDFEWRDNSSISWKTLAKPNAIDDKIIVDIKNRIIHLEKGAPIADTAK